jgi:RecA-family ATPase
MKKPQKAPYNWAEDEIAQLALDTGLRERWAVQFARKFCSDSPRVSLTAIDPDRIKPPVTRTFHKGQDDDMAVWIAGRQRNHSMNIYFNPAETPRPVSKKPTKGDMARSWWLWSDPDLPKTINQGDETAVAAAKAAMLERLHAFPLRLSGNVDSGGGYQVYLKLKEPIEDIAQLEELNLAFANALDADHVHNADRVMRLPCTVNFPDGTKRARGRRASHAELINLDASCSYTLAEIRDALAPWLGQGAAKADRGAKTKGEAKTKPGAPTEASAEAILEGWQGIKAEPLIAALPPYLQQWLGESPPEGSKQRSSHFFRTVYDLFKYRLTVKEARAVVGGSGCAVRFQNEGRLDGEVVRAYEKWVKEGRKVEPPRAKAEDEFEALDTDATYKTCGLIVEDLDKFSPEDIEWLWEGVLARGKLTLLAGPVKQGKSQVSASITAAISTGAIWPVSGKKAPLGKVLILQAEDGISDTLVPRLMAAGADRSKVKHIKAACAKDGNRQFSLADDLSKLSALLKALGDVQLVIIDPITAYMGKIDGNDTTQVRSVLDPVTAFAEEHRIAILAVTHLNKGRDGDAIKRVIGSGAFTAAARINWMVVPDKENRARKLLLPIGSNLGSAEFGYAFKFGRRSIPGMRDQASYVEWEASHVTEYADELLQPVASESSEDKIGREYAAEFLRGELENGPVAAAEILKRAKENGFSQRTIERAKADAKVKAQKVGAAWVWRL